jgi:sulfur carrier protein
MLLNPQNPHLEVRLPHVIQLSVNGESRHVPPGANVTRLLDELGLTGKRVAVERNGEIVPRSRHGETALAEGDKLEIVVAVGGG